MDQSDNHREYVAKNALQCPEGTERNKNEINYIISNLLRADNDWLDVISITHNYISKEVYKTFEKMVNKLYEFLKIFKSDLQGIEIDKKENHDKWVCDLVMVYDSYVLERLRQLGPFPKSEELDSLLPWAEELPEEIETKTKPKK